MMRVVSMKLILLGVTVCFLLTILYGQYHSNTSHSQQKAFGSRWTEDDEGESIWKLTTATQQHMTEGRCSLRKAVRRDQPMRQLFNFSVPVLQWAGSFHKAAWRRLGDHAPPYGWKGLSVNVVRSSLALLNGSVSSVLFERPLEGQCVRCAVVGNGGILRESKQGHAIDSHDLVFRVNGAVTKGFEEDVGTKTSFYGFTTNTMKHSLILYRKEGFTRVPQGSEVRYIFIPSDLRDYVMMTAALQGLAVPSGEDAGDRPWRYFGLKPPEYFKMIHPDFITYVTQRFLKSPLQSYRSTGHLYMPSTGALMLMMALHTCDQVSAYGFITSNYAEFSDHYYDSVKRPLVFFANHDMKMESRLWDALDRKQVLRLYRRAGGS